MDSVLEEILVQLRKTQKVFRPTKEQADVITHPLFEEDGSTARPLLVVAGAGSGKTETMSMRAVYVARKYGIEPQEILGLTFTKKAAGELRTRLTGRFDALEPETGKGLKGANIVQASTYNAFAQGIVQEFGAHIGIRTTGALLNQAAGWQLMYEVVKGWKGTLGERSLTATVDSALHLREDIANQGLTIEQTRKKLEQLQQQFAVRRSEAKRFPAFLEQGEEANLERLALLDVIETFEERKRVLGRLDFADQVTLAWRIIKEDKNVVDTLRKRHKVVFLDEFQDTSYAQLRFLSALFGNHPTTAVGDPHQAIYAWRGGSAASLDDFHRLFSTTKKQKADTLSLMTAWRNDELILKVANRITKAAPKQAVEVPPLKSRPVEKGKEVPQGEVSALYLTSFDDQLAALVDFLQKNQGEAGKKRSQAVLCRRGAAINPVIEALHLAGIEAQTNVGEGVLFYPAVVDLRAALEVTADLGRSTSVMRLLYNWDFSAKELWQLGQIAKKLRQDRSLPHDAIWVEVLEYVKTEHSKGKRKNLEQLSDRVIDRLVGINDQLRAIRRQNGRTVVEQIEHARRVLKLDQEAAAVGKAEVAAAALDYFTQVAADYEEATPGANLQDFLLWLKAAETKERGLSLPSMTTDPNAVQVLTVHASKGLEWDDVAVIDMETGVFPSSRGKNIKVEDGIPFPPYDFSAKSGSDGPKSGGWWKNAGSLPFPARQDYPHLPNTDLVWRPDWKAAEIEDYFRGQMGLYSLEEERNIAYVAFTRPKHRLLIMGSWMSSSNAVSYPSMFLEEAAEVDGVSYQRAPFPTEEEQTKLQEKKTEQLFPPAPGEERKLVQYTALAVQDELRNLESEKLENVDEDVFWVGIDKTLRHRVEALLAAADEDEQKFILAKEDPRWKMITQLLQADRGRQGKVSAAKAAQVARQLVRQLQDGQSSSSYATTGLADAVTDPQYWLNLRRPIPRRPSAEANLGTAFHQWAEQYLRKVAANDSEPQESVPALIDGVSGQILHENSEISQKLDGMKRAFISSDIVEKYKVEGLEMPFSVEIEGLLVRGRIDACLQSRVDGKVLLVDWKTGKPGSLAKEDRLCRYLVQLDIYRHAWNQLRGFTPDAALCFINSGDLTMVGFDELQGKYLGKLKKSWDLKEAIATLDSSR